MDPVPSPDLCLYTVRLRKEDGTEELVTKPCPYYSACRELGRACAELQAKLGDQTR